MVNVYDKNDTCLKRSKENIVKFLTHKGLAWNFHVEQAINNDMYRVPSVGQDTFPFFANA